MEPSQAHEESVGMAESRRTRWQRASLLALAFTVMILSLKACPAEIQIRSTEAIMAYSDVSAPATSSVH